MRRRPTRRGVIQAVALLGTGSIAGCTGASDPTNETTSETTTAATTTGSTTTTQPSLEAFLADTSNFNGIEDRTGTDAVGIDVGVEANGANYGFGPPAVRVDPATTITWTWTGQGGIHNVAARHGADFQSEQTSEADYTFQQVLDATGTVLYVCVPHEGVGMKGAIVVE